MSQATRKYGGESKQSKNEEKRQKERKKGKKTFLVQSV